MFENGEYAHKGDRIVRIGTHTGEGQLQSRISQHFENENKNRSIFRKNIGRCFITQENIDYLPVWDLDTTSKENKKRFIAIVDKEYETTIEKKISKYIQENLTYSLLEISSKMDRLHIEARLVGTISSCTECSPSETWLGAISPISKIVDSGLWQVKELYTEPISENDLELIINTLVNKT
jgi:hypothetical protein